MYSVFSAPVSDTAGFSHTQNASPLEKQDNMCVGPPNKRDEQAAEFLAGDASCSSLPYPHLSFPKKAQFLCVEQPYQ
jgi:hypothetical protein